MQGTDQRNHLGLTARQVPGVFCQEARFFPRVGQQCLDGLRIETEVVQGLEAVGETQVVFHGALDQRRALGEVADMAAVLGDLRVGDGLAVPEDFP